MSDVYLQLFDFDDENNLIQKLIQKEDIRKWTVKQLREYISNKTNKYLNDNIKVGILQSALDTIAGIVLDRDEFVKQDYAGQRTNNTASSNTRKYLVGEGNRGGDAIKSFLEPFKVESEKDTLKEVFERAAANFYGNYKKQNIEYLYKIMGMEEYISNIKITTSTVEDEIKDLIENGQYQIILTGAPGTGKTYSAKKIAEYFIKRDIKNKYFELGMEEEKYDEELKYALENNVEMVQFHPSYDYTDFVEGLRPVDIDGQMHFKKVDGTFKKFCRFVAEENRIDYKLPLYFFIIDEINRADLSKVFGELMFCLESDKRGKNNTIQTQYSNIDTYDVENKKMLSKEEDVFTDGFFIPKNIVIIGTMNDIDRSVESMDFALRRRFVWKEVIVNEELLKGAFDSQRFFAGKGIDTQEISKRVVAFNNKMHQQIPYLNRNYDISQGQFANMPDNKKSDVKTIMEWVWKYRVESLLREYLRGDSQIEKYIDDLKKQWFSESKSINNSSDSQNNSADDGTQK